MHGMTPLEKLRHSGVTSSAKILEFPTMILEDCIDDLKASTNIIRLASELTENHHQLHDQKFLANLKASFQLPWNENAQNVLTHYPFHRFDR